MRNCADVRDWAALMAPPAFWQELGVRLTRQAGRAFERGDAATAALYLGMAARLANRKAPGARQREELLAVLRPAMDGLWEQAGGPTLERMDALWGYAPGTVEQTLRRRGISWSAEKLLSRQRVADCQELSVVAQH